MPKLGKRFEGSNFEAQATPPSKLLDNIKDALHWDKNVEDARVVNIIESCIGQYFKYDKAEDKVFRGIKKKVFAIAVLLQELRVAWGERGSGFEDAVNVFIHSLDGQAWYKSWFEQRSEGDGITPAFPVSSAFWVVP